MFKLVRILSMCHSLLSVNSAHRFIYFFIVMGVFHSIKVALAKWLNSDIGLIYYEGNALSSVSVYNFE